MEGLKTNMSEKIPIILEIGSTYTRMGFVGEDCPRKVIFTPKVLRRFLTTGTRDTLADSGKRVNIEYEIESLLSNMFFNDLLLNLKERQLIFCENIMVNRDFINAFAKVAVHRFFITKIYFFLTNSLPLYISGLTTGIIIDCGYQETQITPIYEGYPIMKGFRFCPAGGKAMSEALKERLTAENTPKLAELIDSHILEDLKSKAVKLLSRDQKDEYFKDEESIKLMKEKFYTYESDKRYFKLSYFSRVAAGESLFGDLSKDQYNVAYELLQCLKAVGPDCSNKLSQNIILAGGSCLIPGFAKRLKQEIIYMVQNDSEYAVLKNLVNSISFTNFIYPSTLLNFIGASILGSLPGIEEFAYTSPKEGEIIVPDRYGDTYIKGYRIKNE